MILIKNSSFEKQVNVNTSDVISLRGMTIATDGEVTEVVEADSTAAEVIGWLEEEFIYLSSL